MREKRRHKTKRNGFSISFPIITMVIVGILIVFPSFTEKSWSYNWDGINGQVKDSVKVSEYKGISSGSVGIAGKRPNQFDRRFWIMKNASESELLKLTEYPNGTIKTIAYEGLIRKKNFENKFDLILKVLDDTEYTVDFWSGCEGSPMYIREYIFDHFLYMYMENFDELDKLSDKFNLTEIELKKIIAEYKKKPKLWK